MVDITCTTARPGGVTLVAVRIDNRVAAPGVPAHRVRLEPTVDGAVWPPRVEGVPAAPWTTGVAETEAEAAAGDTATPAAEVVVPTGSVGSLGFASDAPPADPPVEIAAVEPADPDDPDAGERSAADVLRVLGDPSPPRDVVGVGGESGTTPAGERP